jgi:hypothetical protein
LGDSDAGVLDGYGGIAIAGGSESKYGENKLKESNEAARL